MFNEQNFIRNNVWMALLFVSGNRKIGTTKSLKIPKE